MYSASTPFSSDFSPQQHLPAPLLTSAEIHAAHTTLPCLGPPSQERIVVLGRLFVVRYSTPRLVDADEGHALRALHGTPTIPKLYAMSRQEEKHFLVLVMQFLPGEPLSNVWDTLSGQEKTAVTDQLRATFASVRDLTHPSELRFSSVVGGPVPHRFFMTWTGGPSKTAPLVATEKEFHNAMALRLRQDLEEGNRPNWTADFLERHLATAITGHAFAFSHGDLQMKNILVDRSSSRQADHGAAQFVEPRVSGRR